MGPAPGDPLLPGRPGPSVGEKTVGAFSATGLEHSAHVLEKGGKVFSATLGLVDIVKGTNSYYKLQLLEDDKESRCVLGAGECLRGVLVHAVLSAS